MRNTLLTLAAAIAIAALPSPGRAQFPSAYDRANHNQGRAAPAGGGHAAPASQIVEIAVTSDGFSPARVPVNRGVPVTLVVTRKTDGTCAKEIVIKEYGIRRELPLGNPVTIEFTPEKSGQLSYGCGMGMITGILVVD